MERILRIAIFGQVAKGKESAVYVIKSLKDLFTQLGCSSQDGKALSFAIKALHYGREVYFVPVKEEGFNPQEYRTGVKNLNKYDVDAVFIPGVGNSSIIDFVLCGLNATIIITEEDAYDYLTSLYSDRE